MKLVDRKVVTHSSFLDLFLLAECDFFIGTLSSAFRSQMASAIPNLNPAA